MQNFMQILRTKASRKMRKKILAFNKKALFCAEAYINKKFCVYAYTQNVLFIYAFFLPLTHRSDPLKDLRLIRQTTRFCTRKCFFGIRKLKLNI